MDASKMIKLRPVEGVVFTGNNADEVTEWIAKNIPNVDTITVTYVVGINGKRAAEIVFTTDEGGSTKPRTMVCQGCAVTSGIRRVYKPEEVEA